MDQILRGLAHFEAEIHPAYADLFDRLAHGQQPDVFFITCSDSRIDPSLITQQLPGELFVARNAGNIVPASTTQDLNPDGIIATLEYALEVLGVGNIVVCGHSDCGAMKALLAPESVTETSYVRSWLEHCQGVVEASTDDVDSVIRRNVALQIEHLRSYRSVDERVRSGQLQLHGWVYDIGSGTISAVEV